MSLSLSQFSTSFSPRILFLQLSLPFYFSVLVSVSFSIFISVSFFSALFPISFFSCFLFPFYPSSPDTCFPMNSLDGGDVSFFDVSMCSNPMMNTLNILNPFTCSGFVKKYASIDYVGQYSMLNSSLLNLSLTGKYL